MLQIIKLISILDKDKLSKSEFFLLNLQKVQPFISSAYKIFSCLGDREVFVFEQWFSP